MHISVLRKNPNRLSFSNDYTTYFTELTRDSTDLRCFEWF